MTYRRSLLYSFLSCVLYGQSLLAQSPGASPSAEEKIAALPGPSDGAVSGLVINGSNAQNFKSLIPKEFYPLVRAQLIEMDSVKQLRVDLSPYAKDLQAESNAQDLLAEDGSLKGGFRPTSKYIFPDSSTEENTHTRAQKALWNVQARFWSTALTDQDFSLLWLNEQSISQSVTGHHTRLYPAIVNANDKSIQVFRDRIGITSPLALKNFAWLTFRFFGDEEDMFWLASPAINKVRQLTGFNRSDGIIASSISPDDFFGWSGKPESVDVVFDKETIGLVPFPDISDSVLKANGEKCWLKPDEVTENGSKISHWNFENRRFSQAFPWVPTTSVFVPRKLMRLELIPRDPFSLYGRQILYVDSELFIPYYKFVFDRSGYLWKTVIAAFQPATTPKQDKRYLINKYVIVEDRQKKTSNILEYNHQTVCDGLLPSVHPEDFDPQKLLPMALPTATPLSKATVRKQDMPTND